MPSSANPRALRNAAMRRFFKMFGADTGKGAMARWVISCILVNSIKVTQKALGLPHITFIRYVRKEIVRGGMQYTPCFGMRRANKFSYAPALVTSGKKIRVSI